MPKTHLTMLIGCIAIAGIPPLAGFFSKDEILWSAFKISGYGRVVWGLGFVAAAMTAFYMFRLYHMTFAGAYRGGAEAEAHVHESPASMTVPLQALALGSIVAGFAGIPHVLDVLHVGNLVESFLHPIFASAHETLATLHTHPVPGTGVELGLMAASVLLAAGGIFVATRLFRDDAAAADARLAASFPGAHRLLLNKYWVDEAYGKLFVRGLALGGGNAFWGVDRNLIDGGDGQVRPAWPLSVNGIAWIVRDIVAKLSDLWDRWIVDGLLAGFTSHFFENLSYVFRAVQNGLVQHYALTMLILVLFLIGIGGSLVL
jgi:NADH-quinone oxidoreductase subunit L